MKAALTCVLGLLPMFVCGEGVTVTGTVAITATNAARKTKVDPANVVVWLTPIPGSGAESGLAETAGKKFEIRQTHKRFVPHVLAVPVGALVAFPNLDPVFHNVFSLYDGNRFDLGLYEAGTSHSVRFDRAGISFIFCNIHPEMSAVVVVADGPHGVSDGEGKVVIHDVTPGRYVVNLWGERSHPQADAGGGRDVTISSDAHILPPISLVESNEPLLPHKNKYGLDYEQARPGAVYR